MIADHLVRPGASLGRLLAAHHLETRRAILEIVAVRAGEAWEDLGVPQSATLSRRTYTILIGQRTVAAVTEWLSPGRLASMAVASGATGASDWQPFPRAGARRGFQFVADL